MPKASSYVSGKTGKLKWKNWLNTPSKAPRVAYVLLTKKCNSKCNHCYRGSSPEETETMPMEIRKRAIEQVAESGISGIMFGGGEPTVLGDLFDTLRYAKETYERAGYRKFSIDLETNAYFLKGLDKSEIKKKLEELKSSGLTDLTMASKDRYHNITTSELEKIEEVADKVFGRSRVAVHGATGLINPVGRARSHVPRKKWSIGKDSKHWTSNVNLYKYITINEKGSVFPCCWQTVSMGNINDAPLKDIVEAAKKPGSLPRKLAEVNGFAKLDARRDLNITKKEHKELIRDLGECGACYEYFEGVPKNVQK